MYSLFFNYALCNGFKGLILEHTPVRCRDGSLKKVWLIGVCAAFECKDKLKAFCNQKGGSWEPVKKYWWVPLDFKKEDTNDDRVKEIWSTCREVIDQFSNHLMMAGGINLAFEAAISPEAIATIKAGLLNIIALTNEQIRLESQWEEPPRLTSIRWVDDTDEESAHELTGHEGHYEGMARLEDGSVQKVEVCEKNEPVDVELQKQITFDAGEYRQFLAEDGKRYWCKPAPTGDRYDLGCWLDHKFEDTPTIEAQPQKASVDVIDESIDPKAEELTEEMPDVEIGVILDKSKTPVFFSIKLLSDEGFKFVLPVVKRLPGREWRQERKAWYLPVGEVESVAELIQEYTTKTNGMRGRRKFSLSPKSQELLGAEIVRGCAK